MKLTASFLVCLLARHATARPRPTEEGDPLPQYSRITAFVVDKHGNPSVECWEIGALGSDSRQITRDDGSKARAHALPLAKGQNIDGLDILTWPSSSPIWPIPDDTVRSEWFDLSNSFSLYSVQGGLLSFDLNFRLGGRSDDSPHKYDDDSESHTFSQENGDDWFYFEDSYSDSEAARSKASSPPPFVISTISATETELLRLRYKAQPQHKVVHKGACRFTGIEIPSEPSSAHKAKSSRPHSDLTVQVVLGDNDL